MVKYSYIGAFLVLTLALFLCCKSTTKKAPLSLMTVVEQSANEESDFIPRIEVLTPEGHQLIDDEAVIETLTGGYAWTEGPLHIADGDFLLFSDIPNNKVYKWKRGQEATTYLSPSGYTGEIERAGEPGSNGLLLNPAGQLVLCQHGDRRLSVMDADLSDPKPIYESIVDNYNGKRLNSPNDAIYAPNGDLYFTDPPYGLENLLNDPAKELDFQGVYRYDGKVLHLITKELRFPNGINVSPDGKTLYVANSDPDRIIWMAYDIGQDGIVDNGRIFYDAQMYNNAGKGAPDGLKVSTAGYIYASGPEGVWIFNPAGKVCARIYTGRATSNCALSTDERYLYMTTDDYVMGVPLL